MRHGLAVLVVLCFSTDPGDTAGRPPTPRAGPAESASVGVPFDAVPDDWRDGLVDLVADAFAESAADPLTAAEAAARLESALGRAAATLHLPPYERLVAVGANGRLVGILQGSESDVTLSREFDEPLHVPGAGIILIHNHPGGTGLAPSDLDHLSKPGVEAVVAIGNDGSLYLASADPRHDPRRCRHPFLGPLSRLARSEVQRRIDFRNALPGANPPRVHPHLAHLTALALQHAGAMQYHATLSASRQESYQPHRRTFQRTVEATAATVIDAVGRHVCQRQWPATPPPRGSTPALCGGAGSGCDKG